MVMYTLSPRVVDIGKKPLREYPGLNILRIVDDNDDYEDQADANHARHCPEHFAEHLLYPPHGETLDHVSYERKNDHLHPGSW